MHTPAFPPRVTRRRFISIVGTSAVGAAVLSACGGGNGTTDTTVVGGELTGDAILVRRFPADVLVPGELRLPISVADANGLVTDDNNALPAALTARVLDIDRKNVIVEPFTATKHKNNTQPYYPFTVTMDSVGFYVLQVKGGPEDGVTFQVRNRSDVSVPLLGSALPAFDTPTIDDARGVTPICTRTDGTCPFHTITLTEALEMKKPVVYLIGTPAYCQTGTCAPALDSLIDVSTSIGDKMVFVHAEVYTDNTASTPAPAVKAYNLSYEPVLYVTDSTGTIRSRLDAIFDVDEMRTTLESVL